LCGCHKEQAQQKGPAGPPVMPVSVAKATEESVPTELHVVGTVEASAVVQVKSQIAGQLLTVGFTEGQNVKQGDLLFQIDPRPYDDALHQAEAAVERDQAMITQAEATLAQNAAQVKFAETDAARQEQLNQEKLASKMTADQARTTLDMNRAASRATQASVGTARATMAADQAAVSKARLDRSYCEIHAPISGRTGNLLVHAGNLVKENDVPLVIIHQVEPIFVDFNVPEDHLGAIRRLNAGHSLAVRATLQDGSGRGVAGSLAVIDNTVDASTGTIHLKATFENRDSMLWPGQFVSVALTLDTLRNATVVPAEAVQMGQLGQVVFVVKPDHSVDMRPVTLGTSLGTRTVIEKGVAPGETVVVDGQMALFPGVTVRVVEAPKAGSGPQ
ncbi:MAG: efflux RND transporter periplasmic adaptor subunit, partial [Bryobacteraceae bacterium]